MLVKTSNLKTMRSIGVRNSQRFEPLLWSLGWLLYAAGVAWFAMLSPGYCFAQTPDQAVDWRTGKDFDEFSKSPISVSWRHAALREHLARFARGQQLSIVLDRRIDPNLRLDLTVKNASIEQFMLRVSQAAGANFCRFGDCYYIGPAENAQRLLAINAMLTSGRQNKQSLLSRSEPVAWAALTTPQDVMNRWSQENDFEIAEIQLLQHDLMAEMNTPAMRLDMRMALLLSQFDLWFRQSKSKSMVTIVQPPENLSATLRLSGYDADKTLLQRIRSAAPHCDVSKTNRAITIKGPAGELEMARNVVIVSFIPEQRELDEKRFQLNVKNKRGLILQAVAEQLALKVVVDDDCQEVLEDVVGVTVRDATVEVLLNAILAGTDCAYSQDGTTLRLYRR